MQNKDTRDFLIRNVPVDIYNLLSRAAQEHNRSKNQEAIVALTQGLILLTGQVKRPQPFKWKKKISSRFIQDAIREGRA